jgi:hypothetical protein
VLLAEPSNAANNAYVQAQTPLRQSVHKAEHTPPLPASTFARQERPFAADASADAASTTAAADAATTEADVAAAAIEVGAAAESGSAGGSSAVEPILVRLPTCVTRELADELAINFCYANSKINRRCGAHRTLTVDLLTAPA